jgi:hypothetical protein
MVVGLHRFFAVFLLLAACGDSFLLGHIHFTVAPPAAETRGSEMHGRSSPVHTSLSATTSLNEQETAPTTLPVDSGVSSDVEQTLEIKDVDSDDQGLLDMLGNALEGSMATGSASASASVLVEKLNMLRSRDDGQEAMTEALDKLLGQAGLGPAAVALPAWSGIRVLCRYSRRARQASLRRVLDMSTPAPEAGDPDDEESRLRRMRRALFVLLRSLYTSAVDDANANNRNGAPAIRKVEKAARKDIKSKQISSDDLVNRMPEGLETPRYDVVVQRNRFEIRQYEPFSVCSVEMNNRPRPKTDAKLTNPQLSGASSFGALAGYLFGKNDRSEPMKMTTPVFSAMGKEEVGYNNSASRQMSFVLPSDFWGENGVAKAPQPLPTSGVTLTRVEGGTRAVVMFGGFANKKDVEEKKAQLLNDLRNDKQWKVTEDAEEDVDVTLAQYNDPFTPPWKRRNELAISVAPIEG